MSTLTPEYDQPDPMTASEMQAWANGVVKEMLHKPPTPFNWEQIKANAQTEYAAYRKRRLTELAAQSASELIPNTALHAEMNMLLDNETIPTAEHDLLIMTAGRSPLSVIYEDDKAV